MAFIVPAFSVTVRRLTLRTCMDIAILMNAANWKTENQTEPNLSASAEMYATRDIKKGEELLYDYKSHDIEWESVGL